MEGIQRGIIERVMKQHTDMIVGTDAVEEFSLELEKLIADVTRSASIIAKHNKRRTIKNSDIIVALNAAYDARWLQGE